MRVMRVANFMNLLNKNENVLMYVLENRDLVSSGIINNHQKKKKKTSFIPKSCNLLSNICYSFLATRDLSPHLPTPLR